MRTWLKDLRLQNGLSMAEMGKKLGVSTSYYCKIEHGERQKDLELELATKLSKIFSVSIVQIGRFEANQNG